MLQLEGTVLKYEPFKSKKNKELVSMVIFGTNEEVYEILANFKDVARVDKGNAYKFSVNALPGEKVLLFVNHVIEE